MWELKNKKTMVNHLKKRLTSELSEMFAKSHELEDEIRKKLGAIGYEI